MVKCDGCEELRKDLKELEEKYEASTKSYIQDLLQYNTDKMETKSLLKALHRRADLSEAHVAELFLALKTHMKEEEVHYIEVATHMARTNELLGHVPTREELAIQAARITTGYKIAAIVFVLFMSIGAIGGFYIKTDMAYHVKEKLYDKH